MDKNSNVYTQINFIGLTRNCNGRSHRNFMAIVLQVPKLLNISNKSEKKYIKGT